MFDHLLESSHRDDSNKWSNIGFGEEMTHVESIEVQFTLLIWSSVNAQRKSQVNKDRGLSFCKIFNIFKTKQNMVILVKLTI